MELKERLLKEKKEIEDKLALFEEFPDLSEYVNRWDHKFLCSSLVNNQATGVLINHSCGCCNDAALIAYPFIEYKGFRIYTIPTCFTIGTKNGYGYGDTPSNNWKEILQQANITDIVIQQVNKYFKENPPTFDDEEEED